MGCDGKERMMAKKGGEASGAVLCRHTLVELYDCDAVVLRRTGTVRTRMLKAVRAGGGTIVQSVFHQFSPWGVSGVVVITESHVTIHTWPEHGYAAVDIFSCSPRLDHAEILRILAQDLGAKKVRRRTFRRGGEAYGLGSGRETALPRKRTS